MASPHRNTMTTPRQSRHSHGRQLLPKHAQGILGQHAMLPVDRTFPGRRCTTPWPKARRAAGELVIDLRPGRALRRPGCGVPSRAGSHRSPASNPGTELEAARHEMAILGCLANDI
jgi:hypothetical protein